MKIYLDWISEDNEDGEVVDIEWPDAFRVPVAGETIFVGIGTFRVLDVQWEIDQADFPPSVTLKVASPPGVTR